MADKDELWLPALSLKDHKGRLRNRKKPSFKWTGLAGKTLWDWLQLLIIPAVLAAGVAWFNLAQTQIGIQASQKQHDTDVQIAADQQREDVLVAFENDISALLLNDNLLSSKSGDEVRVVARARTLAALRRLDPNRKGYLLQFLYEAQLVMDSPVGNPIIDLFGANLNQANLPLASLQNADLLGTDLGNADLAGADLSGANLNLAKLSSANLRGANLTFAHMHGTALRGANLRGAFIILGSADLSGANLSEADLERVILKGASLVGAKLVGANLTDADLCDTDLNSADLQDAKLAGACLDGADLFHANLKGAQVASEQLAQAKTLEGATMPDGSIHL